RPDWRERGGEPKNPVYFPYRMLVTPAMVNLLVPGYATGASSLAWAETRVLPNLTVLGDAAGVAAARAVISGEQPADFGMDQIRRVQSKLRQMGARLDK
ncbi:FAD-dependent oxidoreductase, partial [Desulfotomaculum copahuensis]|uniref:FAD-dependent oxidoreductase n=1 Tax=Desulfotomaculum copahuensis TaxID=1838280 RepID=UPI000AA76D91